MTTPHDPELEQFKRSIDLVEYAKKEGYEPSPLSAGPGVRLLLLDHPSGDRVVVAQRPSGDWIYAAVPGYAPRVAGESAEHALARLRASVDRSTDKGSIVQFVQRREGKAREGHLALERVREHLREFCATQLIDQGQKGSPTTDPSRDLAQNGNSALGKCRVGWTPAPADLEALNRALRNRSSDRGR
jgi:hypothetical protein